MQSLMLRFDAAAERMRPQNLPARWSRKLSIERMKCWFIERMKCWFKDEIILRTFASPFSRVISIVRFVIRADLGNMGHLLAALQEEADPLR